ncbi:hypothetical protein HDU85_001029 [Gaertneriomyces sp. JEL0708]|nr:hypothetical protein HDU85_001029 [Gaertneriomyces sp. JEL0708]
MHRQLNRVTKGIRLSASVMHYLLMQFMFQWNVERERDAGLAHDWQSYDLLLLMQCYQTASALYGNAVADKIWHGGVKMTKLATIEQFGLFHDHVTLSRQAESVAVLLPLNDVLLEAVWSHHALNNDPKNVRRSISTFLNNPLDDDSKTASNSAESNVATTSSSTAVCETSPTATEVDPQSPSIKLSQSPAPLSSPALTLSPPSVSAAVSMLPRAELTVMRSLSSMDEVFSKALKSCEWSVATARWNSFVNSSSQRVGYIKLHTLTTESLQASWKVVLNWKAKVEENEIINSQHAASQHPYDHVDIKTQSFNQTELDALTQFVKQSKQSGNKTKVNWSSLANQWYFLWLSQTKADLPGERVLPRNKKTLQSKWESIVRASKKSVDVASPAVVDETINSSSPIASDGCVEHSSVSDTVISDAALTHSDAATTSITTAFATSVTPADVNNQATASRVNTRWSHEETKKFEEIYDRDTTITFAQFKAQWAQTSYGEVTQTRFNNKKMIVQRARDNANQVTTKRRILHSESASNKKSKSE